jgi:hypothetical protein
MKRAQKLILVVFALVDLAVIGGLGLTVLRSSRPTPSQAIPVAPSPSACVAGLLEVLSEEEGSARIDWDEHDGIAAQVTLNVSLAAESLTAPPTPQLLWSLLDRLAPTLRTLCELPPTVTLLVTVPDATGTVYYGMETAGETLAGWLRHDISDTELAAHARYRESRSLAP